MVLDALCLSEVLEFSPLEFSEKKNINIIHTKKLHLIMKSAQYVN